MIATREMMRRGTTLVELLVVLAILATVTALVGMAFVDRAPTNPSATDRIAAARRSAILSGSVVTVSYFAESDSQVAIALPDGSVVGAELAHVDRLSGRPDAAR